MKNIFLTVFIGLFLTFGTTNVFANGNELPISIEIVNEKIAEYLSSNSLQPYIEPGQNEVQLSILDPIIDNEEVAVIFLEGEFMCEGDPLKGLFVVQLIKSTNTTRSKLFCLSDAPLISPILLLDIVNGPQLALLCPEGMKLLKEENGHIFIRSDDSNIDAQCLQTWTLFTPEKSYDVSVLLTKDEKGGTHFSISA